jgi:hypothetical protein
MVEAIMLWRALENVVRLEMDGGRFERLLQLWGAHGSIIRQLAPFDDDVYPENLGYSGDIWCHTPLSHSWSTPKKNGT